MLFCELSQNLYALNGAATLVWCGLEDGLDDKEIVGAMISSGAPAAEAPGWYRQSLEMFALRGLLEGTRPPPTPAVETDAFEGSGITEPMPVRARIHLRVFDSLIELELAEPESQAAIAAIFGRLLHNSQSREPDFVLGVGPVKGSWVVTRDGLVAARAHSLGELAGAIERGVMQLALRAADYLMEFRAALLSRADQGLLLAGPAGSGKTLIAAALMQGGWRFGSQEQVLFTPGEPKFRGAPKNLRLRPESWPQLTALYGELGHAETYASPEGPVRYLVPRGEIAEDAVVTHVVLPRQRPGGTKPIAELSRPEGLQALFSNCASVSRSLALGEVEALVDWSKTVSFHRLDFADPGEAVDRLERQFTICRQPQ